MRHLAQFLSRPARRRRLGAVAALTLLPLIGCAGGGARGPGGGPAPSPRPPSALGAPTPQRLDFLYAFENTRDAPYFPLEGVAGVAFGADGTLFFCDEKGGRVHGHEARSGDWYQFDAPPERPFRPIDVRVDGFSVLVLDSGRRLLLRYEYGGVFHDRLLDFGGLDATSGRFPSAFDVDRDGRLVCSDGASHQILLLDNLLVLQHVLGEPGAHREQYYEPSGVVFLPGGGFVAADRGNRRLQWYNRLGYFESVVGGEFEPHNPLLTPQGLDVDRAGNLFVADPAAGAVHVFDAGLAFVFSAGSELGLLAAPVTPLDLAVGPDDLLAVSDRGRQAILVYRIVYD